MKIEAWEIELKKQFETNDVKIIEDVVEEKKYENTIEESKIIHSPVNSNEDNSTLFFLAMLIILGISILFVYDYKTGGNIKKWMTSAFVSKHIEKIDKEEITEDAEVAKLRTDLEKYKSENKSNIDALSAKINTNANKIGLMGLLLNENFSMIMKGEKSNDFVFFNRDWTLDRMPRYIDLTEDDKEYLKKYVK
jgi:hypothetical protein